MRPNKCDFGRMVVYEGNRVFISLIARPFIYIRLVTTKQKGIISIYKNEIRKMYLNQLSDYESGYQSVQQIQLSLRRITQNFLRIWDEFKLRPSGVPG